MKAFAAAIIILSLWSSCNAQFTIFNAQEEVSLDSEDLLPEEEFLDEVLDVMAEESTTAPDTDGTPETACSNVTLGAEFSDFVGTVLQNLTTDNIFECCEACQELERCTTWSRNREDGYCELHEMERLDFFTDPESEIDIGGIIEIQRPVENSEVNGTQGFAPMTGTRSPEVFADFIASEDAVVPECARTRGVVYPRGSVIVTGRTPSSEFCCELCRSSSDCSSWYFNRRDRNCVLNRNVPQVRRWSSSQFEGGTTTD